MDSDALYRLAEKVSYIGSVEHKDRPSKAGWPRPRADASICPIVLTDDFEYSKELLKKGIKNGDIGSPWEGDFPRYVWLYHSKYGPLEGRLVNSGNGSYKGYPIDDEDLPKGFKK